MRPATKGLRDLAGLLFRNGLRKYRGYYVRGMSERVSP